MEMVQGLECSTEPGELEALAQAAREGDAFAADHLWGIARNRLTRTALALGIPPEEVPDLVQEVLLSGWRNLARFNPAKGSFIAWMTPGLVGRARNRTRSLDRRQRFLDRAKVLFGRFGNAGRGEQDAVEARLTLKRLLQALTDRQREVIALYDLDGLSAGETAEILGISDAGVRAVARDARRRLKAEAGRLA